MMQKYAEYKDSGVDWLGEIPAGWEVKPGMVAFTENKRNNKGMKQDQVLSLSYGNIIIKPKEKLVGLVPESFETYQIIEAGDIIIRGTDLQNDKTSLRTGLAKDDGIITSAYLSLRVRPYFSSRFLHYYLHTLDTSKVIYKYGSGLRQNLSFEDFKRLPVFDILLPEQTAIADFLDEKTAKIDELVEIKRRQIALLGERKQILIQTAVTKGLNPNAPLKDSGVDWIGKIPAHWEVKRLKNLSSVQTGITLGKIYSSRTLVTLPYLRVANVQAGFLVLDDLAEISLPPKLVAKHTIRKNDILITEGGDIDKLGRGTVWKGEIENCLHQNHIFATRVNDCCAAPQFVSLCMESGYGRRYFTTTANKTTNLASTNSTKLGNFPVSLPPLEEQKEIVTYCTMEFAKIDSAVSNKQNQITKLIEYKTTLINAAVTGKIKVPASTNQEAA